ncbi:HAD-IA family hydrolase [Candidatus Dependentiae bacterium]
MKKSNIIFDIDGVLFKENKLKIARKSGLLKLLWYLITHNKNPVKIGYEAFKKMHEAWGTDKKPALMYKKHPMPECIAQWMKGFISNKALLEQVDKFFENLTKIQFFASEFEKNIIKQTLKIILDESEIPKNTKPIEPMIKLVEHIKKSSNHNLFIISNYAKQASHFLIQQHKEFFSLFDDIIISANIGMMKPDAEIFHYFLDKHKAKAGQCIFIDDQEQNVKAAQILGIKSLLYEDFYETFNDLQKLEVI